MAEEDRSQMRLRVQTPAEIVVDEPAVKVLAEAVNGAFALLPRHIDFVAPLAVGVLIFVDREGRERFLGIDEGTLVKCGQDVMVSVRRAIPGDRLETLRPRVETELKELDESEKVARTALARLESGVVKRFMELQERS